MKKNHLSLDALIKKEGSITLNQMFETNKEKFKQRFGFEMANEVTIELTFESSFEATLFYQEIKQNPRYSQQYTVKTHPYHVSVLIVSGATTLFDYFGTVEPNLLTLSRQNQIDFKVDYVQPFSNIVFTGEIVQGELLGRHCIVQVSDVLPELSLAGLPLIGSNRAEFDALLTRIFNVESTRLL